MIHNSMRGVKRLPIQIERPFLCSVLPCQYRFEQAGAYPVKQGTIALHLYLTSLDIQSHAARLRRAGTAATGRGAVAAGPGGLGTQLAVQENGVSAGGDRGPGPRIERGGEQSG